MDQTGLHLEPHPGKLLVLNSYMLTSHLEHMLKRRSIHKNLSLRGRLVRQKQSALVLQYAPTTRLLEASSVFY